MSDKHQTTQRMLSNNEREELLLRVALAERKASLLTQKLQARDRELAALHKLTETIGNERHINRLCEKTAEVIRTTLGATTVSILLLDEQTGDLVSAAAHSGETLNRYHPRLRPGDGPLWQTVKTGKPYKISDSASNEGIAVPIIRNGKILGLMHAAGKLNGRKYASREQELLCSIAGQAAVALDNATLYHNLENLFVGVAWSFAAALDAKSPWTAGHSKRVTNYAVSIAEELSQGPEFLSAVQTCGLLHDIGKIAIPEKILDKPGVITRQERKTICEHASQGAKILEHIDTFQPLIPGIRHHHERWDGRGFPDGLAGEEIPLLARVLAVADAFDAMTSDRPYRKRRNREDAIAEIKRCSNSQFDPAVVEAFSDACSNSLFRSLP